MLYHKTTFKTFIEIPTEMTSNNSSNVTDDRLLLSLSHAPLPTPLLDTLIDQTSTECSSMLDSIEEVQNQFVNEQQQQLQQQHQDEKKDQTPPKIKRRCKNTILHVLATGTPYVIKPGKSQPDYIHQWTKGEEILARLVDKIGMEKFHRVPEDGETKLAGRLIDVKPSDFEFILTQKNSNKGTATKKNVEMGKENVENSKLSSSSSSTKKNDKNANWRDDCLSEELSWIANNILRMLIIDNRPKIGCTKILFPLDPRFEHVNQGEILHFIEGVFKREWSMKDGPLKGAGVEVIVVETV